MAVDAYFFNVNERMAVRKLFDCIFVVLERVVAHVAVAVVVVPLRPARMASALTYRDNDEPGLCETVCAYAHARERIIYGLHLRAWINVIHYRIDLCGVEVERFVHYSVEVGNSVRCLYRKELRELVSVGEEL